MGKEFSIKTIFILMLMSLCLIGGMRLILSSKSQKITKQMIYDGRFDQIREALKD